MRPMMIPRSDASGRTARRAFVFKSQRSRLHLDRHFRVRRLPTWQACAKRTRYLVGKTVTASTKGVKYDLFIVRWRAKNPAGESRS
jgi:hypothetical protein